MYFKFDLSFYMFAIIFWIRRIVKVENKVNKDKYFKMEWVQSSTKKYQIDSTKKYPN
jgi:hypothetical protein